MHAGEAPGKENPDEPPSSSSEDQEDNEQSDDSEIDDYEEQTFEVLFIPDDAVECVAVRWIKVRVREGGHINFERTWGGVRANLDAAGGGPI